MSDLTFTLTRDTSSLLEELTPAHLTRACPSSLIYRVSRGFAVHVDSITNDHDRALASRFLDELNAMHARWRAEEEAHYLPGDDARKVG